MITFGVLFWKFLRRSISVEGSKRIVGALVKFWAVVVVLMIIIYVAIPLILSVIFPDIIVYGCGGPYPPCDPSQGECLTYPLMNLCEITQTLIAIFAMFAFIHMLYLYAIKEVGARFIK